MDHKYMRQLAEGVQNEHCGCDDDIAESRKDAENAIWKFFPNDSKAKIGGHRKVMFTGNVAKAAKLPDYTSIKLSDLTDHQIQSVLAVIQKKRESTEAVSFAALLSEEQILLLKGLDDAALREALLRIAENMAQSDETPEDVRAVAAEFARVGRETVSTLAEGKGWACQECGKKFRTAAAAQKAQENGCPKCGGSDIDLDESTVRDQMKSLLGENDLDEGTLPQKSEKLLRAFLKKHNYELGKDCWIEDGDDRLPYGLYAKADMAAEIADDMNSVGELGKVTLAKVHADPKLRTFKFEGVELGEAGKKTYSQAQDDIMAGLAKDGWKVAKSGPSGTLKVPHATSPHGDIRLYFKSQAIYMSHDKNQYGKSQHDMKSARSLHLGDIRSGDYGSFASQLSRWTGQDMKGNELPKKAPAAAPKPAAAPASAPASAPAQGAPSAPMSPDQYHAKHGQCPDGYHWNGDSKRCVKAEAVEAKGKPCPKCESNMLYDDASDRYECEECGYAGPNGPASEEVLRLAGVQRYPERVLRKTESAFKGRMREYAGLAGRHTDWRFEQPEEDVDLWNPDADNTNPGKLRKPMAKAAPAKPADKGQQLLKALSCPPGKEAKLVYGKPTCVPKGRA